MPETPSASSLLKRVRTRLQTRSFASACYILSMTFLALGILGVLAVRLLGLLPGVEENYWWLAAAVPLAALGALAIQQRIRQSTAAAAIDEHARTKDLFLTLATLSSSAGEYQPLVAQEAEQKAGQIVPNEVVPFHPWRRLGRLAVVGAVMALAILLTPQLDPFGSVAAAEQEEEQRHEIKAIRKANEDRRELLKRKSRQADEASDELENNVAQLKKDFRKMRPKKMESNTKVLTQHRSSLGEQWKQQSTDQLRKMLNRPLSRQQMGGSRSQKMNKWLKELQEGNSDELQKELQKAQQTMQALMEATDPEERKKLASQLKKDLQDLKKFASDRAESKELASALSKALKALEAGQPKQGEAATEEMSQEAMQAMQALQESLDLSQTELEQLARSAKDLKKLEDALKTIQQAQNLNQQGQMDGEKLEGCETLSDYAEMYAQMMGQQGGQGGGPKDLNEGSDGGTGEGGETPEDDSDPEGYKDEKTKTRIKAGKVLLSIKTKEHAEETDFDPDSLREYQASVNSLKDGVQSAIENEEIPPGYVDGIKNYFDRIEDVDPNLKSDQ